MCPTQKALRLRNEIFCTRQSHSDRNVSCGPREQLRRHFQRAIFGIPEAGGAPALV